MTGTPFSALGTPASVTGTPESAPGSPVSAPATSADVRADVLSAARSAKSAAAVLRTLTTNQKNAALETLAARLLAETSHIVAENEVDVAAARESGMAIGLIDRLTLTEQRLAQIVEALLEVVELPDPVGQVVRGYSLPNGLSVEQIRVPMGVVGMIYEARPNVTVDAAGLALKSGNACLLRGSSSATRTNRALVSVMREALVAAGLPQDSIVAVPGESHESVKHLMTARGLVDVLIPRGGAGLIESVVTGSTVPVIETGIGNCHVYVDAHADLDKALAITVNAKAQRPSVCNAAETLLVHADIAGSFLPAVAQALGEAGVTLHADPVAAALVAESAVAVVPVTDADWEAEYYSLDLAVGVVPDIDAAISHIGTWSTGHTEAVISDSASAIRHFLSAVDSAAIAVNASTRFTDGGELGFGAEIGISTQKLHARGPMALPELTTTKFLITGDGHVRD